MCGVEEMVEAFREAKHIRNKRGRQLLHWPDRMHCPHNYWSRIRNLPIWRRDDAVSVTRMMEFLEKNGKTFKQKLQALKRAGFRPAYRHLAAGEWSKVTLYHWEPRV